MKKAGFLLLAHLLAGVPLHGQLVHLTPISFESRSSDVVLLGLQRQSETPGAAPAKPSPLMDPDVILRIQDGKYYIITPNNVDQEDLGDQSIGEFIQYLHGKYPDITFTTTAPEASVSELAEGNHEFSNGVMIINPGLGRPSVAAALGVGFIANDVRSSGTGANTLMRNAGLDLDLVATKPFDWFTVRARVGFHSSEPVPIEEEKEAVPEEPAPEGPSAAQEGETPATPTDPRTLIQGAEAIGLGVEIAVHVPLKLEQVHLSFSLDGSQYWTSPDPFVFPTFVPVSGERKPIGDYFDADAIAAARNQLDRIVPLRTVLVGGRLLFGRRDNYVFYVLADVGTRQYLTRSLRVGYQVDRDADPQVVTPVHLLPQFGQEWESVTRLGLGVRLTSAVDFKVDVVTPLENRPRGGMIHPTLRIHLATPGVKFGR